MARKLLTVAAVLTVSLLTALSVAAKGKEGSPDLRVEQFTVQRLRSVSVPLRLQIAVMIKNHGGPTAETPHTTRLSYRQKSSEPWETLEEWKGTPLSSGGIARYEKVFDLPLTGRVRLTFRAEVDAGGTVEERSEGNNTQVLTERFHAGVPDLAVENLEAVLVKVAPDGTWNCRVEFDVANVGTGPASGTCVTVLRVAGSGGGYRELARWSASDLPPGAKRHCRKTARFEDVESLQFSVSVDADNIIMEKEKQNNTATSDPVEPEEAGEEG
jgi:hypothetical protein